MNTRFAIAFLAAVALAAAVRGADGARARKLIGREPSFNPVPLPEGLRMPWTQEPLKGGG